MRCIPMKTYLALAISKMVITRPNIEVGAYTYYDDADTGGEDFEAHVTHHYEFVGDKLIIGKFCAIGKGVEFVMNGANHRMALGHDLPLQHFRAWLGEMYACAGRIAPQRGYRCGKRCVGSASASWCCPACTSGTARSSAQMRWWQATSRLIPSRAATRAACSVPIFAGVDRISARAPLVGLGAGQDIPQSGGAVQRRSGTNTPCCAVMGAKLYENCHSI